MKDVNFNDHIVFIDNLLNQYKELLEQRVFNDYRFQLSQIKEKHQDKFLNISVVGDFSTGKSTFINALLRKDLLDMSSVQSTTTASITIENGIKLGLIVNQKFKIPLVEIFDSIDELKIKLSEYGANIDNSKSIEKICVKLPSKTLDEKKFRIIDTPGLNATDLWLEDKTKDVVERVSDTSVIVIDANQQLPLKFCNFIRTYLKNVLSRCVFLVTKFDQLRTEKDRERTLKFLKNKIKLEFGIEEPLILPYVSTEVLKDCEIEEGKVNKDYLDLTLQSENKLLEYVQNKRQEIQLNKLAHLMQKLYDDLSSQINNVKGNLEKELDLLLRTKQNDLEKFVLEQKNSLVQRYHTDYDKMLVEYKQACYCASEQCVAAFLKTIDEVKVDDAEVFKSWCEQSFELITTNLKNWMYETLQLKSDFYDKTAIAAVKEFQALFGKYFEEYDLLKITFNLDQISIDTLNLQNSYLGSGATSVLNQAASNNYYANFGGSFATAAVGGLLFGPIGWIFGSFAGSWVGSFFAPKIDEVKKQVKDALTPYLNVIFKQIANELIDNYQRNVDTRCYFIEQEIDKYYYTYQSEVDRQIKEKEEFKLTVEQMIREVKIDLNEIEINKSQIMSVSFSN